MRRRIDRFQHAVQTAGDAIADLFETAGNALRIGALTNLLGALVKGVFGIIGAVPGGVAKLVAGAPLSGLVDIGASIFGALIIAGGMLLALVQRLLFLQSGARRLTASEVETLRRVFGESLSLYNIRIVDGRSGIFALSGRAFTLGNTIYMKKETRPSVLIHECVHVWQYQNLGPRYAADALGAQLIYGMRAYDWRDEPARGRGEWLDFNAEAQAEHIEDCWKESDTEAEAMRCLRAQLNARWSRRLTARAPESEA